MITTQDEELDSGLSRTRTFSNVVRLRTMVVLHPRQQLEVLSARNCQSQHYVSARRLRELEQTRSCAAKLCAAGCGSL